MITSNRETAAGLRNETQTGMPSHIMGTQQEAHDVSQSEHDDEELLATDYTLTMPAELSDHWAVQVLVGNKLDRTFSALEKNLPLPEEDAGSVALAFELAIDDLINQKGHHLYDMDAFAVNKAASAAVNLLLDVRFKQKPPSYDPVLFDCWSLRLGAMSFLMSRGEEYTAWWQKYEHHGSYHLLSQNWPERVHQTLTQCWQTLFKTSCQDFYAPKHQIVETIADLNSTQTTQDPPILEAQSKEEVADAVYMVAMHHWAKATEMVALALCNNDNQEQYCPSEPLAQHFKAAADASEHLLEIHYFLMFKWLYAGSRKLQEAHYDAKFRSSLAPL